MARPTKKAKIQKAVIEIPRKRCSCCGDLLEPTEMSIQRILERGPKNAYPHYLCECSPGELQVYPQWHRIYGLGSLN
jgi:hypothetical protein